MSAIKKLPRILEDDQLTALLRQFNPRYPSGLKNLCMATLMLDAGTSRFGSDRPRTPQHDDV